jgi:hypothetical protein
MECLPSKAWLKGQVHREFSDAGRALSLRENVLTMGLPRPRRPTYPRNQRGPQLTSEPSDSGRHHVITTRSITTAETNLCDPTSVRRQDAAHTKGRQATGRRSQNRNKRSYSAPKNRDRLLVQGYFGQLASGSWRASSEGRELSVGGSNPSPPSRAMDCLASLAMTNLHRRVRQNNPTGKSAKTCPALSAKIFRLTRRANQRYQLARLTRQEGRCARHERAVGCGGRDGSRRRTRLVADGEVVWSWRPGAGAKCARTSSRR